MLKTITLAYQLLLFFFEQTRCQKQNFTTIITLLAC